MQSAPAITVTPTMRQPDQRRTSFFARTPLRSLTSLTSLTTITDSSTEDDPQPRNLRKRRTASIVSEGYPSAVDKTALLDADGHTPPSGGRSSLSSLSRRESKRGSMRPTSMFGSFRSFRTSDDTLEPLSAASSITPSLNWGDLLDLNPGSRNVLHHGEVQTSQTLFRRKKEYLVLTETHLFRLKNASKAAELFNFKTHKQNLSVQQQQPNGSTQEGESYVSDNSADHEMRIPLRQIVAVYGLDDGRPYFAIEVAYLDNEINQAGCMTLQFGDPEERDTWLKAIRSTANEICLADENPISESASHLAARAVERERDYDPSNYAVYKVVQRPSSKLGNRSSTDDLSKIASTVCFLAIGVCKIHIIPLVNVSKRGSSPSLTTLQTQGPYGILSLADVRVNPEDDNFELTFRVPFLEGRTVYLASLASHDIIVRLRQIEEILRPEWESRPFGWSVPRDLDNRVTAACGLQNIGDESLDRTLVAYCAAYDCNPENIRYQIAQGGEDTPRFELLQPANNTESYRPYELLAVIRALRYHETFAGLSFANISLDTLLNRYDIYGAEHACTKTKRGTTIKMKREELENASVLVQEIRALAITNKKLRRMDFTGCFSRERLEAAENLRDAGCGIVEALMPLCKLQATNVDWIVLNGIHLTEADIGYLISAGDDRSCHFRAIEMSGCGLTDRSLALVFDALAPQDSTLEAVDFSSNAARLNPLTLNAQIGLFPFIRKLNLSNLNRTSDLDSLLSERVLLKLRLQELYLGGTNLNPATVQTICRYVETKQSETLRELRLDRTGMSGMDAARIMHSLARSSGEVRHLHLDISQNELEKGHKLLCEAIAAGLAPSQVSIRLIEYRDESLFRELILALTENSTIECLDLSRISLPNDASTELCEALEMMFARNHTLTYLDISGEDSRLESSKLGVGINHSLRGLQSNRTLQILYIEHQKLGLEGANTLAEILRFNHTLHELHCENNSIPLSGFTDMVNALRHNISIMYIPEMAGSRQEHLNQAKAEVKAIKDEQQATMRSYRRSVTLGAGLAIPSKFGAMIRNPRTPRLGMKELPKPPPLTLSEQDIGAALRLVDQNWERQAYRLGQYLARNHAMADGFDVPMEIEEEEFEKDLMDPDLLKLLEDVNFDQTPTLELNDPLMMKAASGSKRGKKDSKALSPNLDGRKKSSSNTLAERPTFNLPELKDL